MIFPTSFLFLGFLLPLPEAAMLLGIWPMEEDCLLLLGFGSSAYWVYCLGPSPTHEVTAGSDVAGSDLTVTIIRACQSHAARAQTEC